MIKSYVGKLGQGKTQGMADEIIAQLKRGRRVVSNIKVSCMHKGKELHTEFYPKGKDFEYQILTVHNATIAIDEASILLPAIYWSRLPPEYINKFHQARHYGCDFLYTTQRFGHTLGRLRDLTDYVVSCHKRRFPLLLPYIVKHPKAKVWYRKYALKLEIPYVFIYDTFDPLYFESHLTSWKAWDKYHIRRRVMFPSAYRPVQRSYDTLYIVDSTSFQKKHSYLETLRNRSDNGKEKEPSEVVSEGSLATP